MAFFGIKNKAEKEAVNILLEGYQKLKQVESELHKEHAFKVLVDFFNATSTMHDSLPIIIEALKNNKKASVALGAFQAELKKGGRDPYGINRTEKGERVTNDKVYLGDIYGLHTLNITKWLKSDHAKKDYKGSYSGKKLGFNPIYQQAENFVESYLQPKEGESLLKIMAELLKALDVKI
jgi:hypothetical protein